MQLHHLVRTTSNKKSRRVGRGGKRGKTSGRGTKGQKARAGHKMRPEMRDIIKKLPKRRGHGKNRSRTVNPDRIESAIVNVGVLGTMFTEGTAVTPKLLLDSGLVKRIKGRTPPVKILGKGELDKKLSISGCTVSKGALEKIKKAGGEFTVKIVPPIKTKINA